MGAYQNNGKLDNKKRGKRGSTNNASRLEAFARPKSEGTADWGDCDPSLIQAAIVGVTALGGAMTFGLSRDKGAHTLTLLLDDSRETLWFNGDADLDESVRAVVETLKYIE